MQLAVSGYLLFFFCIVVYYVTKRLSVKCVCVCAFFLMDFHIYAYITDLISQNLVYFCYLVFENFHFTAIIA